jgi:ABC-type Zn uptake system ZnuABC Zn-binding protein ZnuA
LVAIDPGHRAYYDANAKRYDGQLDGLRAEIARQIATIPKGRRTMIVFHNAWQYYNDRFGIRTVGVIELSPGQEPNPQYIGQLVDLAKADGVHAVFAEPEYSPKLVNALAKSAGIRTVQSLYDDSIGGNARVANYVDMLRYDTGVIVRALR